MSTPNYPQTFPGPAASLEVARLMIGGSGGKVLQVFGGYLLAWDGATYENTVSGGAQQYTNLACIAPTLLAVGPVLLIRTDARPIILGRLYQAVSTA